MEIRAISAAETRPMRQAILRPHQKIAELVYRGDDAENSLHVGDFLWCHARTPSVPFYRALGFQTRGGEFEERGIGRHFFMWREVSRIATTSEQT